MSTEPVKVFSGMVVTPDVTVAATAKQALVKQALPQGEGKGFRALKNLSTSATLYMGPDATVTNLTGWAMDPGETFVLSGAGRLWMGDIWVYSAAPVNYVTMEY